MIITDLWSIKKHAIIPHYSPAAWAHDYDSIWGVWTDLPAGNGFHLGSINSKVSESPSQEAS
jgi:hypothetical protein